MSTFISYFVDDLSKKAAPAASSSTSAGVRITSNRSKELLRELFINVDRAHSLSSLRQCIGQLQGLEHEQQLLSAELVGEEEESLRQAILGKVALGLYAHALTTFLEEASEAETELEWWSDLGRSRTNVAYYVLQTLPLRVANASMMVLSTLRSRDIPIHLSTLKPASIRHLFPSEGSLRPHALAAAMFPHLQRQPYNITLATMTASMSSTRTTVLALPYSLARDECAYKQTELSRIRDDRAEVLGSLVNLRDRLALALQEPSSDAAFYALAEFAQYLQAVLDGGDSDLVGSADRHPGAVLESLSTLANITLPSHASLHGAEVKANQLKRPSQLTLLWPRLVFLPPLVLYAIKTAYASRATLEDFAKETFETVKGFWEDWVITPIRGIIHTVRAGREDGVIVTKDSVRADLESLERMTLALALEKLHYSSAQLELLSRQVQAGDLTAVMQIYEDDIKTPLKSAVQGTLLRSLFIQIQKTKVDINQALSGIDKLLKSQELTFAFVGVAPALTILYAAAGYIGTVLSGGRGRGRYGGKARRSSVWLTMRRLERLLVSEPAPSHGHHGDRVRARQSVLSFASLDASAAPDAVPPLTAGLLLLSVTRLRRYAESSLPPRSRLHEGFLSDVADLESPSFGRADKLRILDRMWRSWSEPLGWNRIAA
ncbi:NCA2-domain-containing protein [Epithele typhae]|uniref:NCA2-domain-containing protein n=1 Tax=Epithele typhae TaxID=378194 RepID=UPI0020087AAB|nr:NCA2-domain-containing protein [Epithele typhae]KAH9924282.1 NCA2-domain-containing protein [Epithele typhae]